MLELELELGKWLRNSFSQMGSHPSAPIGKLCRSAFSFTPSVGCFIFHGIQRGGLQGRLTCGELRFAGASPLNPMITLQREWFSLILARSFWTGRGVSSAGSLLEVLELHESLARLPSPFELPVAQKEEPDYADKALTTSLIHLLWTSRKSAVTRSMRSEGPCELAGASETFGWDS
jgi:hypothetical protein